MLLNTIRKYFAQGNVSISGNCGSGKDLLMANVAVRSKGYISNVDYGGNFIPIDFDLLNVGFNTYNNFISGDVKKYVYPYPLGYDIFISDCGIYFPSQYCNELNKRYPYFPTFFAIRRHAGRCSIHTNSQHLGRVWDKLREQSDLYLVCRKAIVIGKLVIQKITIYDRFDSAEKRIKPCRVHCPLLAGQNAKMQAQIAVDNFTNTHGTVKDAILIYINKSNYDTHHFKKLLEEGKID